jgi:DNA (cytosine-5)-methyltransferase 1
MSGYVMRYVSICSGIEAASVAWHPLGFEPVMFADIDPFASAVLQCRFPNVPNVGDFTQIGIKHHVENIDLLVGGTPCQAFSTSGDQLGMDDPRGKLSIEFIRLIERIQPRWIVWENVVGVLRNDKGRALGSFLGALGKCGYGFAYRILDAQHFGVPQRRRRIFVIGYRGGDWRRAAAVLFEQENLQRDNIPTRNKLGVNKKAALAKNGSDHTRQIENDSDIVSISKFNFFTYKIMEKNIANTLMKNSGSETIGADGCIVIRQGNALRRFMPKECERLMGFPPDWTSVMYKGLLAKDGPRYAALGNSMAVPCMSWLGSRIAMVDSIKTNIAAEA